MPRGHPKRYEITILFHNGETTGWVNMSRSSAVETLDEIEEAVAGRKDVIRYDDILVNPKFVCSARIDEQEPTPTGAPR